MGEAPQEGQSPPGTVEPMMMMMMNFIFKFSVACIKHADPCRRAV